MAKFSIEVKGDLLSDRFIENLTKQLEDALVKASFDQIVRMRLRTQAGESTDGQSFVPYTESYARFREQRGRRSSPVDLTFTGEMLRAMQVLKSGHDSQKAFVEIGFSSALAGTKASANQERRDFFGISPEEERQIQLSVESQLDLKKANR